jgi:hypothetical protein
MIRLEFHNVKSLRARSNELLQIRVESFATKIFTAGAEST